MAEKAKKTSAVFERLKKIKHIEFIIAAIAAAVMLVIYFASFSGGSSTKADAQTVASADYCVKMEERLTKAISAISGAGKAEIVINWECSVEYILAYTTNVSTSAGSSSSQSTPQLVNAGGSSQPIIIKEIYPKALGVLVVASGAGNARVKIDIMTAVSTVLAITQDKVIVLPKK